MNDANGSDGDIDILKTSLIRDPEKLEEIMIFVHGRATYLSRYMPDLFNSGISAEDVAGDVIADLLASPSLLGWDPGKTGLANENDLQASLLKFLGNVVLPRRVIDHIRRNRLGNRHFPVSVDAQNFVEHGVAGCSAADVVEILELVDLLKKDMDGDREIERFIDAALLIYSRSKVDQQLADILGESTRYVVNLRRRFKRKLRGKGKLEWWTKAITLARSSSEKPTS